MVIRNRKPGNTISDAARERRKAQRKLARDLKAGKPILPKEITRKEKAIAGHREKLIREINKFKKAHYGDQPKYNNKGADKATRRTPDGKPRTTSELELIYDKVLRAEEELDRDQFWWEWDNVFEDEETDASAFYYH